MARQGRRALRPTVEAGELESRQLLSSIIALMAANKPAPVPAINALSNRLATSPPIYSGNTGTVGLGNGLSNNNASPLIGNGLATPEETARQTFRAGFVGRVYTGPGRFSDQSTTYYIRGLGGSNFFLHGDFNMAIVTPTDPTAPFLGEAVMNDKSTGTSGIIGLVLTGSRTAVDSHGRPTQLTFTSDPNIYSGIFSVSASSGTVSITYGRNNSAKAVFSGLVYTSGLTSPLVNSDLYARQGRPVKFRGK
jgi:hypothetical protein